MRISLPLQNRGMPLHPWLLLVANFISVAGVCAQSPNGSYVAAFRTPKHVMASKPEVFHDTVEEIVRYLENNQVELVRDPLRPRIETQDTISIESLVKIAKDSGAAYLIYFIVDRPLSQWLKVTVQCYDLDQKMLWQEAAGYTGTLDVNSKKALPEIMKKLGKELAPRLDHPGLVLRKTATVSPPAAEERPDQ
jgi:hypothetical protein